MERTTIIAICGPTASGKSTLACSLYASLANLALPTKLLVSDTTRPARPNEVDGRDYNFISTETFADNVHNDMYLEWTVFRDWFYGTSKLALIPNGINIGVFDIHGIFALRDNPNIEVVPIYLKVNCFKRMKRYQKRAGKWTFEQFRRLAADAIDFYNIDCYLDAYFPQNLVLKNGEIQENTTKITQYLVSLGLIDNKILGQNDIIL